MALRNYTINRKKSTPFWGNSLRAEGRGGAEPFDRLRLAEGPSDHAARREEPVGQRPKRFLDGGAVEIPELLVFVRERRESR